MGGGCYEENYHSWRVQPGTTNLISRDNLSDNKASNAPPSSFNSILVYQTFLSSGPQLVNQTCPHSTLIVKLPKWSFPPKESELTMLHQGERGCWMTQM